MFKEVTALEGCFPVAPEPVISNSRLAGKQVSRQTINPLNWVALADINAILEQRISAFRNGSHRAVQEIQIAWGTRVTAEANWLGAPKPEKLFRTAPRSELPGSSRA
jgi:hypothetical protein